MGPGFARHRCVYAINRSDVSGSKTFSRQLTACCGPAATLCICTTHERLVYDALTAAVHGPSGVPQP
jgi:hypothetical protein